MYNEQYRPQFHFSLARGWMNDPSGLLYTNGTYHMFYQYNPAGTTWGAISWGHATTEDLTHWEHQSVALLVKGLPNNNTEMFFSGSVVVDEKNTSGFGEDGKYLKDQTLPSKKKVREKQQSQSIAYSLDQGKTWTAYDEANPVILEPPTAYSDQYQEFRDPNVFCNEPTGKWALVLSLARVHKLLIYTSDDLKNWSVASGFGAYNAVGGVWECHSFFPLPVDGDELNVKWVAIIGLNRGGPPSTVGSGNQYIFGDFNGIVLTPDPDSIHVDGKANWLDFGLDFYAALVYNGLPKYQRTVVAWMNNWQYGEKVPTSPRRSAMTIPHRMSLRTINDKVMVVQEPEEDWDVITGKPHTAHFASLPEGVHHMGSTGKAPAINLTFNDREGSGPSLEAPEFGITFRATQNFRQQTRVGYNFATKQVFVDRTVSGNPPFDDTFASIYHAPLLSSDDGEVTLRIFVDWSSVEVFGGQGRDQPDCSDFPFRERYLWTIVLKWRIHEGSSFEYC
ncbi:glycosyl hydrolase [Aspergillus heterothallicus]